MTASINLNLTSKGVPPASWHLPAWLYRMLYWRETQVGAINQTISFDGTAQLLSRDLGPIHIEVTPDAVTVTMAGFPIGNFPLPFKGSRVIDWNHGGFHLTGNVSVA